MMACSDAFAAIPVVLLPGLVAMPFLLPAQKGGSGDGGVDLRRRQGEISTRQAASNMPSCLPKWCWITNGRLAKNNTPDLSGLQSGNVGLTMPCYLLKRYLQEAVDDEDNRC